LKIRPSAVQAAGTVSLVCPAYLVTGKEKLFSPRQAGTDQTYLHGKSCHPGGCRMPSSAHAAKTASSVCQSRIVHTRVWDELEERLKKLNLHSEEKIKSLSTLFRHP